MIFAKRNIKYQKAHEQDNYSANGFGGRPYAAVRRRRNIGTSTTIVFKMSSADAMYGLLGGLISNQIP